MMKRLMKQSKMPIAILFAMITYAQYSCAQLIPTNMWVSVLDDKGNAQPGATVKVYATEDDYHDDKNVVATEKADDKGIAKFKKLETKSYFIKAQKGDMTNEDNTYQTGALAEKKRNLVNIIISGYSAPPVKKQ